MPLAQLGKDNGIVIDLHADLLRRAVWSRVRLLATTSVESLRAMSAVDLVQNGFVDPIRVFVKNEPHPLSKLEEGRVRLIHSVSLVDQLVERVLFSKQNQLELACFTLIPSKSGMGISNQLQRQTVVAMRPKSSGSPFSSDVSGWDFSVSGDELDFDAQLRVELGSMEGTPGREAVLNRVRCLALAVFQFSDGSMIAQTVGRWQKSGSYNTSSSNSRIRVACALEAGAEAAMAMGDDCVDSGCDPAVIRQLGHHVKLYEKTCMSAGDFANVMSATYDEYMRIGGLLQLCRWQPRPSLLGALESKDCVQFEFCSTLFIQKGDVSGGIFLNWPKPFYRLLSQTSDQPGHLCEFVELMDGNPRVADCLLLLLRSGWVDAILKDPLSSAWTEAFRAAKAAHSLAEYRNGFVERAGDGADYPSMPRYFFQLPVDEAFVSCFGAAATEQSGAFVKH